MNFLTLLALSITCIMVSFGILICARNSSDYRYKQVSKQHFGQIQNKNIGMLCEQENEIITIMMREKNDDDPVFRGEFYKVVMSPLQTVCFTKIKYGGAWLAWGYGGRKTVCLDTFHDQPCLVYMLSLTKDTSFAEAMLEMGCEVFGYLNGADEAGGVGFGKLATKTDLNDSGLPRGNVTVTANLGSELRRNNLVGRNISYLWVNITREETTVLTEWLSSGLLDKVLQIGFGMSDVLHSLSEYHLLLKKLQTSGFRIISWDCNMQEHYRLHTKLCPNFEIVLMKKKSYCEI